MKIHRGFQASNLIQRDTKTKEKKAQKPLHQIFKDMAIPMSLREEPLCTCLHYESRHVSDGGPCLAFRGNSDNACWCRSFNERTSK